MQPYQYTAYTPSDRKPPVVQAPTPMSPAPMRAFEPTDHTGVAIAGLGLLFVILTWLPAGLITGPMALARIRDFEQGVQDGRYNPRELQQFKVARALAWTSVILSLPSILFGAFIVLLLLAH